MFTSEGVWLKEGKTCRVRIKDTGLQVDLSSIFFFLISLLFLMVLSIHLLNCKLQSINYCADERGIRLCLYLPCAMYELLKES